MLQILPNERKCCDTRKKRIIFLYDNSRFSSILLLPVIDRQDRGVVDLLYRGVHIPEKPFLNCVAIWTAGMPSKYGIRVACTVHCLAKCSKYCRWCYRFSVEFFMHLSSFVKKNNSV